MHYNHVQYLNYLVAYFEARSLIMKILIIGSGGREHALSWKCIQSPIVEKVYVAPGNAGTMLEENIENVDISPQSFADLAEFVESNNIGLTIVGPEQPLVDGICDYFQSRKLPIFGPNKNAAQLEGSKTFTKEFLKRNNIPTAEYKTFSDQTLAIEYLKTINFPVVIKADGLAAGKGVIIAETYRQAKTSITDILSRNRFGNAGNTIVIEQFLTGEEASFILIADGEDFLPMATSQDHKRAFDGDEGPNTGGMGAHSPAPIVTNVIYERIIDEVIKPTLKGMRREGNYYSGFLYAGLMISDDGTPNVIEFNCRFGDPETQPVLLRLKSDLVAHCLAAVEGSLNEEIADWESKHSLGVVMASGGYPGSYKNGNSIKGLLNIDDTLDHKIFHSGTKIIDGQVVTDGGRVLCVTALGNNLSQAKTRAYDVVSKIHWNNVQYRTDIGWRAMKNIKSAK